MTDPTPLHPEAEPPAPRIILRLTISDRDVAYPPGFQTDVECAYAAEDRFKVVSLMRQMARAIEGATPFPYVKWERL